MEKLWKFDLSCQVEADKSTQCFHDEPQCMWCIESFQCNWFLLIPSNLIN